MNNLSIIEPAGELAEINFNLFDSFVTYTDREPTTTKGYITCLRAFADWLELQEVRRPNRADILAYKEYLNGAHFGKNGENELKPGTKQQYLRAVKHFLSGRLQKESIPILQTMYTRPK